MAHEDPRRPQGPVRRVEERAFRLLTRLYPRAFRSRYDAELIEFFRAERARPRHRGPTGALRFWKSTLLDLTRASFRGRARQIPREATMRLSDLPRHLTLSLRSFRRRPGFAATVTLTLAVGIAAMLVVFTLVDAALLEALPFAGGDRVVFVRGTTVQDRQDVRGASEPELRAWIERTESFDALAALSGPTLNLALEDGVRPVASELVTGEYFRVMPVSPLLGRLLGPQDDRAADGHPVVVIHEELWEEQFDRDPEIIGRSARFNDRELTIVGVVPRHFGGITLNTRAWAPLQMASLIGQNVQEPNWGRRWLVGIGRLAENVSIEAVQAELDAVALELAGERPDSNEGRTGTLQPARSAYLGSAEDLLVVLLVASVGLLLVATLNAAGLLTVRAASQRDEHAICRALGAGKVAIGARVLVDALVLAAAAAGVAWLLARWALDLLLANLPAGALPPFVDPRLDAGTLLFASGVVVVASLLAGLLPALQSSRGDLTAALGDVRTTAAGGGRSWGRSPQQLLVVAEVAVALVLLVGTGLMVRTVQQTLAVEEGFDPAGVSSVRVRLTGERYAEAEARNGFVQQARQRLEEVAGIESVSYGSDVPLRGGGSASILLLDPQDEESRVRYYRHRVAPDFRQLMGIELLAGRDLSPDDTAGAPRVVLVGREFAERLLGGVEEAVGRELMLGPEETSTVVGVVETVRWRDLTTDLTAGDDDPDVYLPFAQQTVAVIEFPMRTRQGVEALMPRLREAVADVDPEAATFALVDLESLLYRQTAGDRLTVAVLATFGGAALLLAGIAVYGALASAVAHRRRELAIRQALGATAAEVRRSVLRQGAGLAAVGAAIGCVVAIFASRYLADLMFGVSTLDLPTYAVAVGVLLAVAVLATWLPALRATRIEPQRALRS